MNRPYGLLTAAFLAFAALAQGQNLLSNPGFEDFGSGWTLWKDASATDAVASVTYPATGAHTGSRYAQIVVTTPSAENWHIQFQPPGDWEAGMGTTYEMKFWARSAASSSMHFSVQDGPDNGYLYRSGFDFSFTPEWAEYSFTYTSDVEGAGALRFFLYVGANADTLGFDDFSLVALATGVRDGVARGARGLRVQQGAGNLVVSLGEAASPSWKAELFDLRGLSLSSAAGRGDGSVMLDLPKKSGTYLLRAGTPTHSWVRKISIP